MIKKIFDCKSFKGSAMTIIIVINIITIIIITR